MSHSTPPTKPPLTRRYLTKEGGVDENRRNTRIERIIRRLEFERELHDTVLEGLRKQTETTNPDTLAEAAILDLIGITELDLDCIEEAIKTLSEIRQYKPDYGT